MTDFAAIRARAEERKGGAEALLRLLPAIPDKAKVASLADDRVLSEMTKRIFCAGFVWGVIEKKWPGFEAAFLNFDVGALLFQPEEFWVDLASDKRIIRNGPKIMSVRANAEFVREIAKEHGSFGRFLASWPADDQIGLVTLLGKRGSRLGGNTGPMLLRFLGWDGYFLSKDVVACLRNAGVGIAEQPTSKGDLAKAQAQFNRWAADTGLPYLHLSRICAMSIGENRAADHITVDGPDL